MFKSATVSSMAGVLVFGLWFPGIYRLLSGGRELFLLVTSVDVALGPLLTFAVFNLKKGKAQLSRDLIAIGSIQSAALVYGLITAYGARPVALVFEVDRFRVVTAAMVHKPELPKALPEYRRLPWNGPWLLGTRVPVGDERNEALFMAVQNGIDWGQRPQFWQPYADSVSAVIARARPLSALLNKRPEITTDVRRALQDLKLNEIDAKFLPVIGRGGDWVVVIDPAGQLVHYVQADGFF